MIVGLNIVNRLKNKEKVIFPETTMIGALSKYIATPNKKFQPMNANFGIFPPLNLKIKDKKLKYEKLADRAIGEMNKIGLQQFSDVI